MIENTILMRNRQGFKARAFSLTFPCRELVELAAAAGFDAIHLDGEHGTFSTEGVDAMVGIAHGYGLSVIARVPSIDPAAINQWCDRGIQGVMGPHIETGAQAQQLADACLLPPAGRRSWGTWRGTAFNNPRLVDAAGGMAGFADWSNANMIVIAQIESQLGYDNLDAILAVPTIGVIAEGPNDLAASMGLPNQPSHPDSVAIGRSIQNRARAAGKHLYGDIIVSMRLEDTLLDAGHAFVRGHAATAVTGSA
jgi:4-hydroxy-2-oxoheptanedioate aldolase